MIDGVQRSRIGAALWAPAVVVASWLVASVSVRHGILFTRPLWLDEYHTVMVASRASLAQIVGDLAAGVDLAPPLLHFTTWFARQIVGSLYPTMLHALSFAAVAAALVLVYATLRRRFGVASSVSGMLAVGGHALVVSHAFEARYYGPWLMLCALFCWAIGLPDRTCQRRRAALVAVAAVGVCTIHWFGVLTLALMCLGAAVAPAGSPERDRAALRRLLPALVGVMVLLACLPLLFAQRSHFTTPIWVPDLNAAQLLEMGRALFISLVPIAAVLVLLVSSFSDARPAWSATLLSLRDPGIAAACALAFMPILIVLVSLLVQPTMLPRYAIAATLAWAPLIALATDVLRPVHRVLWCGFLALVWWVNLSSEAEGRAQFARDVEADTRAFDRARASGVPVVFQSRHVLYPVAARRESLRTQMTLLVLPDSLLDRMFAAASGAEEMGRFFRFEREAVQRHVERFAFPRVEPLAALDTLREFALVGSDASLPRGYKDVQRFGAAVFPAFHVRRVSEQLALFERQ